LASNEEEHQTTHKQKNLPTLGGNLNKATTLDTDFVKGVEWCMKYFVTGTTGFIGGRVARQLLAAGHEVIALVRTPSRTQELVALGVKVHAGDITDKESLRTPMTGVDGVFHIAAWYKIGAREKSQAEEINVGGTRNVLLMMKELGIPKGVYTSTLTVFSDTRGQMVDETYKYTDTSFLSEYDRTKWHYR
jgi:nucleoside-diphosphate-sugar epimerase